jgi:hypothetical protein
LTRQRTVFTLKKSGAARVVPASYQLGCTLIEHDLVDEMRLVVFPVVLGAGERVLGETSNNSPCAPSIPRPSVTALPSLPTSSTNKIEPASIAAPPSVAVEPAIVPRVPTLLGNEFAGVVDIGADPFARVPGL